MSQKKTKSKNEIVVDEVNCPITDLGNRSVTWMMTPETTGGQYSALCTVEVHPGEKARPAHAHPNGEETIYIVSGHGKVLIGDEVYDIKPGVAMLFPQGVPHMLWNQGKDPLKGICFYAPKLDATTYEYHEDVDFQKQ